MVVECETFKVTWVNYYASFHQILLVGEGDFSFSLSLARAFGSGYNIVATSLDSYESLLKKYKRAKSKLKQLEELGASLLHGVDATNMKHHCDLRMRKFDRIIFNFPHAGFHGKEDNVRLIKMHRSLLHGFFYNAAGMLRPDGEVHVNHKTSAPFSRWNLEELAASHSLELLERVSFKIEDYPGYKNKRGDGSRSDDPFPLGECSTFKFVISDAAVKKVKNQRNLFLGEAVMGQRAEVPSYGIGRIQSTHHGFSCPPPNPYLVNNFYGYMESPVSAADTTETCFWIFDWYFSYVSETFGLSDSSCGYNAREGLRLGFERYMGGAMKGTLSGYIILLRELQRLSHSRIAWLESMLAGNVYRS